MDMLKLAVEAQLPMVAVYTRDVMNFHAVLEEVTQKKALVWMGDAQLPVLEQALIWHHCKPKAILPLMSMYGKMMKTQSTLILVNPSAIEEPMFDAGEAPVPKSLMMKFMMQVVNDKARAESLVRGLGGCTLKEAAELARLTMARDASLTVPGLTAIRKDCFQGAQGLSQVETKQGFYKPSQELVTWAQKEKAFFLTGNDPRLIPRGLLADGKPGTGKTAAAKYLASVWGVPLFRLDVAATKSKWVGSSEGNLAVNLARADREESCIVLLDEVEKIFSQNHEDSSGTTSGMLSQMLWWLAERKSRVFAFMTTNAAKDLPKELYREGRVDRVMLFEGLTEPDAVVFADELLSTFGLKSGDGRLKSAMKVANMTFAKTDMSGGVRVSHAALTEAVTQFIKGQEKPHLTPVGKLPS
jgi:hypothetical protein